jgi:hypothetical protein
VQGTKVKKVTGTINSLLQQRMTYRVIKDKQQIKVGPCMLLSRITS